MSQAYDREWIREVEALAAIPRVVYAGALGPTYETPAEARMFASLGADVVGMSTVQEVIAAKQLGMRVLGLSFATNYSGGAGGEVSHAEVLEMAKKESENLAVRLTNIIDLVLR
jgi:purine-nucleoside phosphorylase